MASGRCAAHLGWAPVIFTLNCTMQASTFPKLHFREPFEGRVALEVPDKGWYNGVTVELEDGRMLPLFFCDPNCLEHDLAMAKAQGEPFVAEHFMIVVPEVTEAAMRTAISGLYRKGWFNERGAT